MIIKLANFSKMDILLSNITSSDRNIQRNARATLTVITSTISKAVSVFTSLISIPLLVSYLGNERFGLWVTISSLVTFLEFTDLGLGNGLINAISNANGLDDRKAAQKYVSSTFFLLWGIACLSIIVFILIYPIIHWAPLLNVESPLARSEVGPSILVFILFSLIYIPMNMVSKIQLGYQEGYLNNFWDIISNVLKLLAVLFCFSVNAGLVWLVFSIAISPLIGASFNTILLVKKRNFLQPRIKSFSTTSAKALLSVGFLFFLLQISGLLAFSADNLLIARLVGLEAVTDYSIPVKLFSLVSLMIGILFTPLWPAYGEAVARKDFQWVRRTIKRSLLLALLFSIPLSFFMIIFGNTLLLLWTKSATQAPFSLLLGLGIWTVLASLGGALATFLNGANFIKFETICALLMATASIIFKVLLITKIGMPGAIWGTVLAYATFVAMPSLVSIPVLLRHLQVKRL